MEAFIHETHRHAQRLCLRFPKRPEQSLIDKIKAHGGRYRKAGKGERSCWFIPTESGPALIADLGDGHFVSNLLASLMKGGAVIKTTPVTINAEECSQSEANDKDTMEAQAPPRKRQRRSLRSSGGNCLACMWQLRMLRRQKL